MKIKRQCKNCGNEFVPSNRGKRGRETKFCSFNCALLWQKDNYHNTMKNGVNKICPSCHRNFYTRKGLSKQIYCSGDCFGISRRNIPMSDENKIKKSAIMALKISNGEFNPKSKCKHGYYISSITKTEEFYNSSYELKRMKQLDENNITWTKKHNIRIPYINSNKQNRYYVPDFLVNNTIVEEIKPQSLLNKDNNPEKFSAAIQYCKNKNLEFKVITEKELRIK